MTAVGIVLAAQSTNTLSVSSSSGHSGDELTMAVNLANSDEASAIELQIPLSTHTKYVNGSATLNESRFTNHTLIATVVDDILKIYIYSLSLDAIVGNYGEIITFKLQLGNEPADYDISPMAILSDATGSAIDVDVIPGIATLLAPKLTITTPTINWGRVAIRSSYNKTLTLKNTGNEPIKVSNFNFSSSDFATTSTELTIAPGNAENVTVTYSPIIRGTASETVTVHSNAINGSQSAQLLATPFSVNELHVLSASGNSDEEVTINLRLKNMEPIVGMQCSLKLPEQLVYVDGSFIVDTDRCTDHQALSSLNNSILSLYLYSPVNSVIEEGDDIVASFRLRLNGTNGYYILTPTDIILSNITEENMLSASSGSYVTIKSPKLESSDTLDMGSNAITKLAETSYSIFNSGQTDLTIERITFLSDGYSVKDDLPITIGAKATGCVTICFNPLVAGAHTTTMQVYTNDPLNRMKSVKISGTIFEPNYLTVSSIENGDISNYTLDLAMDNYSDIVALQMDIHWLGEMTTDFESLSKSDRLSNHSVAISKIDNGIYRVVIYSMSNNLISSKSGSLITLEYQNSNLTNFYGSAVTIDNIVMSDAYGNNLASENSIIYTINPIVATAIELNLTEAKILVGNTLELKSTITPANTTDKHVSWSTSNNDVATVIDNGNGSAKVLMLREGTAVITVSTCDGSNLSATCVVSSSTTGVDAIATDACSIAVENGAIVVKNGVGAVTVYNTMGVAAATAEANGNELRIEALQSGIYVVTIADKVVKVKL